MTTIGRIWPLALTLGCGACVTLNEPVLTPQSVGSGQRTIVMVYPSPGPWVVTDSESKAESAAKMLPVFSYAVQSYQDDRYKAASDTLSKYVPAWGTGPLLQEALLKQLQPAFPGRLVPVAEADPDTATLRRWNRAADALDWQNKYLYPDPTLPHPRDYSRVLAWDDALALEVNVLPMLAADDDGNMVPTLAASTRLFRCQTMHLLWKHEDKVEDTTGARTLYEFETLPQQLVDRWKALVPALAAKVSSGMRTSLNPGLAGSSGTAAGFSAPSVSSAAAPGQASGPAAGATGLAVSTQAAAAPAPAPPAVSTQAAGAPSAGAPDLRLSTGTASAPAVLTLSTQTSPAAPMAPAATPPAVSTQPAPAPTAPSGP